MERDFNIKLDNGKVVRVYRSSLRGTFISSVDFNTEYKETFKNSKVYTSIN